MIISSITKISSVFTVLDVTLLLNFLNQIQIRRKDMTLLLINSYFQANKDDGA